MTIDGKKVYQIGIPIHQGFRGIQEDEDKNARTLPIGYANGGRSECVHAGVQGLYGEGGESLGGFSNWVI